MAQDITLTINEYQRIAMTTCMDSSRNFAYMMFNLIAEVAEACEKAADYLATYNKDIQLTNELRQMAKFGQTYSNIAKTIRKEPHSPEAQNAEILDTFIHLMNGKEKELMQKELGDCLWQLSGINTILGFKLEDTAWQNIHKLLSRKNRNKIDGNGDER